MAYVLALIPAGFGLLKLYRNYFIHDNNELQADAVRKRGIVERLITGTSPPVIHLSDKEIERIIRTNSACKEYEQVIRDVREKHVSNVSCKTTSNGL